MKVLTERDQKVLRFIESSNLIFTSKQIGDIFYSTGNSKSANVIARRRLQAMRELGKLKMTTKVIGQPCIYYYEKLPKKLPHRLIMSEFLRMISVNRFKIIDVQIEYNGFRAVGLVPDMRIIVEYHGTKYVLLVEVDLTKNFTNEEKYLKIVANKRNFIQQLPHPTRIINICDRKPETEKLDVIWIDTKFEKFNNFLWAFSLK